MKKDNPLNLANETVGFEETIQPKGEYNPVGTSAARLIYRH